MMLTENFSLREMSRSTTADRLGIPNVPGRFEVDALLLLCQRVLEPLRAHFARPVRVLSGYRSLELNKAVGGSKKSQHMHGQAADFEVPGVSNADVIRWIQKSVDFDQAILEFYDPADPQSGWVHCSYVSPAGNRASILTARRTPSIVYLPGLVLDPPANA